MAPFFANQSCDPFTAKERKCELGNYVSYAVKAASKLDIAATISFAKRSNVRLVIRNTGHEFVIPSALLSQFQSKRPCH